MSQLRSRSMHRYIYFDLKQSYIHASPQAHTWCKHVSCMSRNNEYYVWHRGRGHYHQTIYTSVQYAHSSVTVAVLYSTQHVSLCWHCRHGKRITSEEHGIANVIPATATQVRALTLQCILNTLHQVHPDPIHYCRSLTEATLTTGLSVHKELTMMAVGAHHRLSQTHRCTRCEQWQKCILMKRL